MRWGEPLLPAMSDSKWRAVACCVRLGLIVVAWGATPALAGAPTQGAPEIPGAAPGARVNVEMVVFADTRRAGPGRLRGRRRRVAPRHGSAHVAAGIRRAAGADAGQSQGGARCRRRRPLRPALEPSARPGLPGADVPALRQLGRRTRRL